MCRALAAIRPLGARLTWTVRCGEPKQFSGDAEINQFAVTLQGIALQATGPLRASLHDGVLHLTQAHITGPDTNLVGHRYRGFDG